jgi:hypothetical protein
VQTISAGAGWTFNNSPTFDNATPFAVTNSALIANLNAEQLNSQPASYYAVDGEVVHRTGAVAESIDGVKTFSATINADAAAVAGEGLRIRGTSPSSASNLAFISFYESDNSTLQGRVGRIQTSDSDFDVSGHVGNVNITASDVSSTQPQVVVSTGGLTVYTGATELLDATLAGTGESGALRFRAQDGNMRNAGFNETPTVTVSGVPFIINANHIGAFLTRTSTTNTDIRLDNALNNYPVGASFMVHNDNATGLMRVVENGTTLEWVDGSGSAPLTGNRTIAYNGVATVRKKATGTYQIWGTGIS